MCVIKKKLLRLEFLCLAQNFPHRKKKTLRRSSLDVSPEIVGFPPTSSHFNRVFHYFHHPFWGTVPLFSKNIHLASLSRNCLMASSLETPPTSLPEDWGFLNVESQFFCLVAWGGFLEIIIWNLLSPKAPCDPQRIFKWNAATTVKIFHTG